MNDRKFYEDRIGIAKRQLINAEQALIDFNDAPEQNVFDTLQDALDTIEENLRDRAVHDCEGAGNRGDEEYSKDFTVDGVAYEATLTVEYNRHDKTYYYIDEAKLTHKLKETV